jgi:hypothetical protein
MMLHFLLNSFEHVLYTLDVLPCGLALFLRFVFCLHSCNEVDALDVLPQLVDAVTKLLDMRAGQLLPLPASQRHCWLNEKSTTLFV